MRARVAAPILIVEDYSETSQALQRILSVRGYASVVARHGQEALEYLRAGNLVSLVILDLYMPVMDGWEFSRALQVDPRLAGTPLVAFSAGAVSEVPGALAFIRKTVDPDVLLDLVGHMVGRSTVGGRTPPTVN